MNHALPKRFEKMFEIYKYCFLIISMGNLDKGKIECSEGRAG